MRSFAKSIIIQAAVLAGLPEGAVMDKPEKENITLPEKRIQMEYLEEVLDRKFRKVSRIPKTQEPEDSHPHNTIRARIYKTRLTVRAEVRSNDGAWLERFIKEFLIHLPHRAATPDNDLVTIEATRAVRSGFKTRTVEVFKKRSNALHILFTGMVCKDRMVPLITDINLKDNVNYKE